MLKWLKVLLISICVLSFTLVSVGWLMLRMVTAGEMPSEQVAISIRDDALVFQAQYDKSDAKTTELPKTISDLDPFYFKVTDSGILIIFWKRYVEASGYYFCRDVDIASETRWSQSQLTDVAPGVYRFFDGG